MVLSIPVRIVGRRKNGSEYTRYDWLPTDRLGVGQVLSNEAVPEHVREARAKQQVLQELGVRQGDQVVVQEVSDEIAYYDPTRRWRISTMSTQTQDGEIRTSVTMDRPMAALRSAAAFLPAAEHILDEAFEESPGDCYCVIRQLSALTGLDEEDLKANFDCVTGGDEWRSVGISPNQLKDWCRVQRRAFYCVSGSALVDAEVPEADPDEPAPRGVAFCAFDGHCFMYQSCRVVSEWAVKDPEVGRQERLKAESRGEAPPFSEWQRFDPTFVQPGWFYAWDVERARAQLMAEGRSPRPQLRDMSTLRGLSYRCVQKLDGCKGLCVVRELPAEAEAFKAWLSRLPIRHPRPFVADRHLDLR
jgi:hypothetical protein